LRRRLLAWYRANDHRARRLEAAPERRPLSGAEAEHLRALGYAQ
jgi:hypothetical protein